VIFLSLSALSVKAGEASVKVKQENQFFHLVVKGYLHNVGTRQVLLGCFPELQEMENQSF